MLEVDASTCKWIFFSLLSRKQCKTFSPFPHHSVTTESLSSILGEIFVLALFGGPLFVNDVIFGLSSTWSWHVYTIVRDTRSNCGGPLTWKA